MRRVLPAGLLALPVSLALSGEVSAQSPGCASGNCNTIAARGTYNPGGATYLGCGACFRYLDKIHQHGPLFNYGPYYGYYPFEPYGPWGSDLRYKLPWPPPAACGGHDRDGSRAGLFHRAGCGCSKCGGGWGAYALATFKNVFHRVHASGSSCSSCGGDTVAVAPIPEAPTGPVVQTGYARRER